MMRFMTGLFLGLSLATAAASTGVVIPRGPLFGWEIQFNGKVICTDPTAYPDFHDSGHSIIACDSE